MKVLGVDQSWAAHTLRTSCDFDFVLVGLVAESGAARERLERFCWLVLHRFPLPLWLPSDLIEIPLRME